MFCLVWKKLGYVRVTEPSDSVTEYTNSKNSLGKFSSTLGRVKVPSFITKSLPTFVAKSGLFWINWVVKSYACRVVPQSKSLSFWSAPIAFKYILGINFMKLFACCVPEVK